MTLKDRLKLDYRHRNNPYKGYEIMHNPADRKGAMRLLRIGVSTLLTYHHHHGIVRVSRAEGTKMTAFKRSARLEAEETTGWFSRNYRNAIGVGIIAILIGLLAWGVYIIWSTPPDYANYAPEATNNPPEVTVPKLIQYQVTHPVEGWECIEIRYDGELRDVQCK